MSKGVVWHGLGSLRLSEMLGPKVEECWGAKLWSVRENLGWEPKSVAVLEEGDNSENASQKR